MFAGVQHQKVYLRVKDVGLWYMPIPVSWDVNKGLPVARVDAVVSWKSPQCAGNVTEKKPAATFKVEHLCCVESHPHIPPMLGEHTFFT